MDQPAGHDEDSSFYFVSFENSAGVGDSQVFLPVASLLRRTEKGNLSDSRK